MTFSQISNNLGARMAIVAFNLISKYGDDNVVFTNSTPGVFDPTTGKVGQPIEINYSTQGISSSFTQAELMSSTIQYGDMKYLIYPPSNGVLPQIGDTVTLSGITYRVMNVINNNLQGSLLYFELQLRV